MGVVMIIGTLELTQPYSGARVNHGSLFFKSLILHGLVRCIRFCRGRLVRDIKDAITTTMEATTIQQWRRHQGQ